MKNGKVEDKRRQRYLFPNCKGPLKEDCWACKTVRDCYKTKMYPFSMIPMFIIENYMDKISRTAWHVLVYINARTLFKKDTKNYAKSWLTFKQISKATGVKVKSMGKYIDELEEVGLIESEWAQIRGKGGGVVTTHKFTITWLEKLVAIKERMPKEDPNDDPDRDNKEYD